MFDKKPKIRLIFIFGYIGSLFPIYNMQIGIVFKVLITLLMLFYIYMSLVKAEIIQDEKARNINIYAFDIISIVFIIYAITSFL